MRFFCMGNITQHFMLQAILRNTNFDNTTVMQGKYIERINQSSSSDCDKTLRMTPPWATIIVAPPKSSPPNNVGGRTFWRMIL